MICFIGIPSYDWWTKFLQLTWLNWVDDHRFPIPRTPCTRRQISLVIAYWIWCIHHLRRKVVRHSCNMPCPSCSFSFGHLLNTGFTVELREFTIHRPWQVRLKRYVRTTYLSWMDSYERSQWIALSFNCSPSGHTFSRCYPRRCKWNWRDLWKDNAHHLCPTAVQTENTYDNSQLTTQGSIMKFEAK